jgi:hypothetical protein
MSQNTINTTITTVTELDGYLTSQFAAAIVQAARVALPGPQTVTTIEDFMEGAEKILDVATSGSNDIEVHTILICKWTQPAADGTYLEVACKDRQGLDVGGGHGSGLIWIPGGDGSIPAIKTLIAEALGEGWAIDECAPAAPREHWGADQYAGGLTYAGDITATRTA